METLTRKQAAKVLGVSETQVRVFEKTGQLRPTVLASGKRLHSSAEVDDLVEQRKQAKESRAAQEAEVDDSGTSDAWWSRLQFERERRQRLSDEQTRQHELDRHERRMRRLVEQRAKLELDHLKSLPRRSRPRSSSEILGECLQLSFPLVAVLGLAVLVKHLPDGPSAAEGDD